MACATVDLAGYDWPSHGRISLTGTLACTDVRVGVCRPGGTDGTAVSTDDEVVCVTIGGNGTIDATENHSVPARGVARVPPNTDARLGGAGTWLIVSADTDATGGDVRVVDPAEVQFSPPETSDVDIARLTAVLGCTAMKVNLRRLDPGQAVPYHVEGTQEEVFVPLDGAGTVLFEKTPYELAMGDVARAGPTVPRSVLNEGEESRTWFMVGAPPTGPSNAWDPGAEIREWPVDVPRPGQH